MNNKNWKKSLKEAITDPQELLACLELDSAWLPEIQTAASLFGLKVPRRWVARMEKGNIHDPLLQQVLPLGKELRAEPGYNSDPLQEKKYNPIPGLLHKYHGRVLLTFAGVCAINCRYCFRRHFAYEENNPGQAGWKKALDYIRHDPTITEVILSGGDPLIATDQALQLFTEQLTTITHVKRLRLHTRFPIVLPERITPELIQAITSPSLQTIVVVHVNHPREIDEEVKQTMQQLRQSDIFLLNQTVLLKNINDQADTLIALSEALFAIGVLPYYLHVLDKVQGTAHFDLPHKTACLLHQEMMRRLPGYLVPKLVCEQPGGFAKQAIYS